MSTTMSKYGASINRPLSEIVGLSTDVKPTDKVEGVPIQNGSTFFEMDTNKKYRFDIESKQWNLVDGGGGGGSATLIEKTITANGTYLPADDEATAYSKVTVNVPVNFEYVTFSDISQSDGLGLLCKKDDGVYVLPLGRDIFQDQENAGHYNSYLLTPAITICPSNVETGKIVFTPGENFDFVNRSGESLSGITGDAITPNDGKVYYLTIYVDLSEGYRLVREVTKTNIDFYSSVIR